MAIRIVNAAITVVVRAGTEIHSPVERGGAVAVPPMMTSSAGNTVTITSALVSRPMQASAPSSRRPPKSVTIASAKTAAVAKAPDSVPGPASRTVRAAAAARDEPGRYSLNRLTMCTP